MRRNFFAALGRSNNISPAAGSGQSHVAFDPMYRASNLDGYTQNFSDF
jgi:hypothetical protein